MLRAAFFARLELSSKKQSLNLCTLTSVVQRVSVSTNSAIHRGIRRSKSGAIRGEPSSRYDRGRTDGFSAERRSPASQEELRRRPHRPNHQARQDVDDIRESTILNEERKSLRQEKYLRGGARELRMPRYSHQGSYEPRARFNADPGKASASEHINIRKYPLASGAIRKYPSSAPPSFSGPNRATRRAAIYGEPYNSPDSNQKPEQGGYHAEAPTAQLSARSKGSISQRNRDFGMNRGFEKSNFAAFDGERNGVYGERRSAYRESSNDYGEQRAGHEEQRSDYGDRKGYGEEPRSVYGERQSAYQERRGGNEENNHEFEERRSDNRNRSEVSEFYTRDTINSGRSPGLRVKTNPPQGIPYTTPASEFLYGTSVIIAALKSSRRKFYKLYIYSGENREAGTRDAAVGKLGLAAGVEVINVEGEWLRLMDKMSNGRPHNGYILEASPLPTMPAVGLQPVRKLEDPLNVSLDYQSREEEAINGTNPNIKYQTGFPRYPFVLILDGIVDPGNLGAILRTAYFLGVDAVGISNRNSAPLGPIALKASAGASESLPLLSIAQPANFIDEARRNGWKCYSAVAPSSSSLFSSPISSDSSSSRRGAFTTSTLGCPLRNHPCILMLGGEGEGLRKILQKKADFTVGVEGYRMGHGGVDSLNVSVATGLLCEAFMRIPISAMEAYGRSTPRQSARQRESSDDEPVVSSRVDYDARRDEVLSRQPSSTELWEGMTVGGVESKEVEEEEGGGIDESAVHVFDEKEVPVGRNRLF